MLQNPFYWYSLFKYRLLWSYIKWLEWNAQCHSSEMLSVWKHCNTGFSFQLCLYVQCETDLTITSIDRKQKKVLLLAENQFNFSLLKVPTIKLALNWKVIQHFRFMRKDSLFYTVAVWDQVVSRKSEESHMAHEQVFNIFKPSLCLLYTFLQAILSQKNCFHTAELPWTGSLIGQRLFSGKIYENDLVLSWLFEPIITF